MSARYVQGRWIADFYIYHPKQKKIKRGTDYEGNGFPTKQDALRWERKIKAEDDKRRKDAKFVESYPQFRTIEELISRYKSSARYSRLRHSTRSRYEILERHFRSFCDKKNIVHVSSFTRDMAREFERYCQDTFSGKGVIHLLQFGKALFKEELNRDKPAIETNPFSAVTMPKIQRKKPRVFSEEEIRLLFSVMNPKEKAVFTLLLNTGMRTKELLYLKWEYVTDAGITITDTGEWKPKTSKSYRTIPLNDSARNALAELGKGGRSGYVVSGDKGAYINWLYKRFRRAVGHLQTKGVVISNDVHGFRRTFGSRLLQRAVPIAVISNLLGHESISTTERQYADLVQTNLEDAVKVLNEF